MTKFEIPKNKKATRLNKAIPVEVERETYDDEHEKLYRDFEQEVKDAELEKAQKIPKVQAAEAEATTAAAAHAVVTVAAAALKAAADGQTIIKNIAEAAEASEASEAREMEGKDRDSCPHTRKKEDGEKRTNSLNQHEDQSKYQVENRTKRQDKIQKILEDFKGTSNILSIKSVKKRILTPIVKNKKRNHQHETGNCKCFR